MKHYLALIDTKTSGNRCDVTPFFADAKAFKQLIIDLSEPFSSENIDKIACIDALGFILGGAIANYLGVGLIPIRKGSKLPVKTDSINFTDYSGELKTLEIREDISLQNQRILLVDEWIETGTQIRAAISLIEKKGGSIEGIATINIDNNKHTSELKAKYSVHSLIC